MATCGKSIPDRGTYEKEQVKGWCMHGRSKRENARRLDWRSNRSCGALKNTVRAAAST